MPPLAHSIQPAQTTFQSPRSAAGSPLPAIPQGPRTHSCSEGDMHSLVVVSMEDGQHRPPRNSSAAPSGLRLTGLYLPVPFSPEPRVSPGQEQRLADHGMPSPTATPPGLGRLPSCTALPLGSRSVKESGLLRKGCCPHALGLQREGSRESQMGTLAATPMRIAIYSRSCQNHQGLTEGVRGGGSNTDLRASQEREGAGRSCPSLSNATGRGPPLTGTLPTPTSSFLGRRGGGEVGRGVV